MTRRLALVIALVAVAISGVMPSQAAAKKKHPDIKGGYDLTLYPDPTTDVIYLNHDGCGGASPKGTDKHAFTVPAAGKLTVHLVSPDPTGSVKGYGTDWDLWIMGTDDSTFDQSTGGTSDEQTTTTFKKKTNILIEACNSAGEPNAHVDYLFHYA